VIGGNIFPYKKVLISGAHNQIELPAHFLTKKETASLPLSSRRDVIVYRTDVLSADLDITGMPIAVLYVMSSCVDTDFTVKLIDEYPRSIDYPSGFAMNVTHGIVRCRYRNSREKAELMEPGHVYEVVIELYPTSNLFKAGHRIRLDVSSSNFPHFGTVSFFSFRALRSSSHLFLARLTHVISYV
jgi:putative CocE/NonD family hydrolase